MGTYGAESSSDTERMVIFGSYFGRISWNDARLLYRDSMENPIYRYIAD